jgi:hypothetical protein
MRLSVSKSDVSEMFAGVDLPTAAVASSWVVSECSWIDLPSTTTLDWTISFDYRTLAYIFDNGPGQADEGALANT